MRKARSAVDIAALGAVVYGLWLILSGHYTPWLLGMGLVATILVVYVAYRMDVVDHEGVPIIHLSLRIIGYSFWLIGEVVKSNLAATRIVLSPTMRISPTVVRFRGQQRSDLGKVIFANSITLTPGTVTVAVKGQDFYVHALFEEAVDGIEEGEMNRRVAQLEEGVPVP